MLSRSLVYKDLNGISFSFYSQEDIKKLSAVKITDPQAFDSLANPSEGGCYDPRMGPLDFSSKCPTCGLKGFECPGHLGHIELMLPIYNPLLFRITIKLLSCKCFLCHKFISSSETMKQCVERLKLAEIGDISASYEIEDSQMFVKQAALIQKKNEKESKRNQSSKYKKPTKQIEDEAEEGEESSEESEDDEMEEEMEEEEIKQLRKENWGKGLNAKEYLDKLLSKIPKKEPVIKASTTLIEQRRNQIFNEFFKMAKGGTKRVCANCSGPIAKLKSDGRVKLFRRSLGKAQEQLLRSLGKSFDITIEGDTNESSLDIKSEDLKKSKNEVVSVNEEEDTKLKYLTPTEVREHFRRLWDREQSTLDPLFSAIHRAYNLPATRRASPDMFFLETLVVTANRFRPPNKVNGANTEHAHNLYLNRVLAVNKELQDIYNNNELDRQKKQDMILSANLQVQANINFYFDNKDAPVSAKLPPGITQILEKKEGLFRRNMMGKRVNHAARTVISPDPFLMTNQIGVPDYFAKRLTYPQPVTAFNFKEMQQAVINGPHKHPGANAIEDERGYLVDLSRMSDHARKGLARTLLTYLEKGSAPHAIKIVHRHLRDGDVVILNRQPTLHKPSMMGHYVKVLTGDKVMRFHYANCATYNADFDGDEMNIHFPQNELARAEAMEIVSSDYQYITTRNGQPLRGLIQDNVGAGVLLTQRDTFFTRYQFQQLVYEACLEVNFEHPIELPIPAILKPRPLWTGKQVVSTVVNQVTWGKTPLNLSCKCKIPEELWGKGSGEAIVIFRQNDLVAGILEKSQYGSSAFGLIHACHELHGPKTSGLLLSVLSRLLTIYMRDIGFTCGMDDMIMNSKAEEERRNIIHRSSTIGIEVSKNYTEKTEPEDVMEVLSSQMRKETERSVMDSLMKQKLHPITSEIISACIPSNQVKKFPINNMSLMTVSGAKGSNVNFSQISCLLGQQELEGKRVPMMASGKTLPCFDPFDTRPRAGGFIAQRFLTGIKPQEYYFHCMAGREGLIDTAVKTSRSGYLQRCLIKHLEGLKVHYDHTVRESADGSVIQFHYGEDSLNIDKIKFLENLSFMASNYNALLAIHRPQQTERERVDPENCTVAKLETKQAHKFHKEIEKNPNADPVLSRLNPSYHIGAVSEKFQNDLMNYINKNPDKILKDSENPGGIDKNKFKTIMYMKYYHSIIHPGESVGVVAGQSIGEPSTQMTLNTFHLAGRGDVNVTLGIPRLREILMTASKTMATPSMSLYLHDPSEVSARRLARKLYRLVLPELIEEITVKESLKSVGGSRFRFYKIQIGFKPERSYNDKFELTYEELAHILKTRFLHSLNLSIRRTLKGKTGASLGRASKADLPTSGSVEEEEESSAKATKDVDEENEAVNRKVKRSEGVQYDAEEEEEISRKARTDVEEVEELDEDEIIEDNENVESEENEESGDNEDHGERMDRTETIEVEQPVVEEKKEKKEKKPKTPKKISGGKTAGSDGFVEESEFDTADGTFTFQLRIPTSGKKLLMISLVEAVAAKFVVKCLKGINKCSVTKRDDKKKGEIYLLQTEGVNFYEVWKYRDYIDVNSIGCNDIYSILQTYGVEAARNAIASEIGGVFEVYGISVDYRHLSLIADYMTFDGGFRAMNRNTMAYNPSPLHRMSFETTVSFIKSSAMRGDLDTLKTPSASIVMGQPMRHGTGSFEIITPISLSKPDAMET